MLRHASTNFNLRIYLKSPGLTHKNDYGMFKKFESQIKKLVIATRSTEKKHTRACDSVHAATNSVIIYVAKMHPHRITKNNKPQRKKASSWTSL